MTRQREIEDRLSAIKAPQPGDDIVFEDIFWLLERVKAQQEALEFVANTMGGPTMTYSPENEIKEWYSRWIVCSGRIAAVLSQKEAA